MHEETKEFLSQMIIDLHYKAVVESKPELRKIADDISDILKEEREKCYT